MVWDMCKWMRYALGFIGAVIMFAAGVSYKDATSNLSGWYDLIIGNAPDWLASGQADLIGFYAGAATTLSIVSIWGYRNLPEHFRRISWDFNDYNLALPSQRQSIGTSEDTMLYGEVEYRISQFQLKGRNNSKKPIEHVGGYIRSDKTNRKIPLLLEGRPPEETHGIPGKCEFWVRVIFPNSHGTMEGYTIEDFWMHFGEFTFVFEYDGKKYEKQFTRKAIEKLINKLKEDANKGLKPKDAPRVKMK